jgi:hypothetical protein
VSGTVHSKESLVWGGGGDNSVVIVAVVASDGGIAATSAAAVSAEKGSRRTPSCSPLAMAAMAPSLDPNDTVETRLRDCDADPPRDHVDVDRLALALLLELLWLLTLQLGVTSAEKPAGVVDRLSEEPAFAAAAAAAAAAAGEALGRGMAALETLRLFRLDDAALRV